MDFRGFCLLKFEYNVNCIGKSKCGKSIVIPRQRGVTVSGIALGVDTINKTSVNRYRFRLGDRLSHKTVSTQDKVASKLAVVSLGNDASIMTAAKAPMAALSRSIAGVRGNAQAL